jgi:hypothetical protein
MYLGASIMTFALPMAAFIVIAGLLFYAYRRPHHNPQLRYLEPETVTAVGTREPGPVPVPAPAPAPKAAATAAPATVAPETVAQATVAPETTEAEADAADSAPEGKE